MAVDYATLGQMLSQRLRSKVRIHERKDGVLMLDTPFTFPDGDHYPIYLTETGNGSIRLSDRGHTLMHVSYDHDVDSFFTGTRAVLREQIVRDYGIKEKDGVFAVDTDPAQLADALFRFGQAMTKIYDLTFLSRHRTASTFYEDLKEMLFTILDRDKVEVDYVPQGIPNASVYLVDYRFDGRDDRPVFLYGVASQSKARLTTISLSHFLLHDLAFDSLIVFADQQTLPRADLARLTNVCGPAVSSLGAEKELRRKIGRLAA